MMEETIVRLGTSGRKVKLQKVGQTVTIGDTSYYSGFRHLILIGGYASEKEALEESYKLNKDFKTWIYEEIKTPSRGTLLVCDQYDNEKARGTRLVHEPV